MTLPDPTGPVAGEPADRSVEPASEPAPDVAPERPATALDRPVTVPEPPGRTTDLTGRVIDLTDRTIDVTDRTIDVTERGLQHADPATPEPLAVPGESSEDRQRALGARLRRIRAQQGLSLAQVEQRSAGRWKAVVVGAYERGDRAVTVERLAALAAFYDVPVSHVLPSPVPVSEFAPATGVPLDLNRLAVHDERPDALGSIARFARRMQLQRGDHAGRVITLRDVDVRTIALAAGVEPDELRQDLLAAGVCDR